jgi:ABC-type multidrug transport system ATPase subunit
MNGPALLVMDEPLTGVDIRTRQLILEWMASLRGMGMTIVYSTHHTDEIENTADELLVLREGLVSFFGPVGAAGSVAGLLAECS